jgi:protein-S-isoprenylcysteine O-methyltransferase Ste14
MDPLRIFLFGGLVVHKLLWEVLKNRDRSVARSPIHASSARKLIKLVKAFALLFFVCQTLFLDLLPIAEEPFALRFLGAAIFSFGLATALMGRLQLGRNWSDLEESRILPGQSLTTGGIYRYIRHPIYSGDILLLVGLQLALNSWLVIAIAIPLSIVVKQALAEEAMLARTYPDYNSYRMRTKRFIPFIA